MLNKAPDDDGDEQAQRRTRERRRAQARAALLRQTLRWHWISAAICLVGMLLFAATGITLNHAASIPAQTKIIERTGVLPSAPLTALKAQNGEGGLPSVVRGWLKDELGVRAPAGAAVEWSPDEAYVALPRPGADAWLTIGLTDGAVAYERTERGAVAYLNDLHKGRDSGPAWKLFIDVFAAGCVVFCATGLILLQLHAHARRSTWPLVGLGVAIPLLIAVFLIH